MKRKYFFITLGLGLFVMIAALPLFLAAGSKPALVHIYWGKSTKVGWSCSKGAIKVILDNTQIGELREKECLKVAVHPGEHVLKDLKQLAVKPQDLVFEADAGKKVFIRGDCSNSSRDWEWNLQTADQAKGWEESCRDVTGAP